MPFMGADIVSHHFQLVQEQVKRQEVVLAQRNEIE